MLFILYGKMKFAADAAQKQNGAGGRVAGGRVAQAAGLSRKQSGRRQSGAGSRVAGGDEPVTPSPRDHPAPGARKNTAGKNPFNNEKSML